MKQIFTVILTFLNVGIIFSQQNPTNNSPAGAIQNGSNNQQFWSRAGNSNFPGNNNNNIFGTLWNSPIYTQTNGRNHMKLNGNTNYQIGSIAAPLHPNTKDGYLLLGLEPQVPGLLNLFQTPNLTNNAGAFSQLHITGLRAGADGYRPWMHTGVTLTGNDDLSYFGLRKLGNLNTNDRNETVICWSNDASLQYGFEDMVFRFTNEVPGYTNVIDNADFNRASDLDGRHIARFTGTGEFGLGNTFGVNVNLTNNANPPIWLNTIYVRPKSLAHLSTSKLDTVWMQFTNRETQLNTGTGENDADGLRIGILGSDPNTPSTLLGNGTAAIYNQEERPILLSTNQATSTINIQNGNTRERVRIMSVGTPTSVGGAAPAVYNPAGILNTDITRVSISHNPLNPITAPLSLLHLGYGVLNTPGPGVPPTPLTFGWRPWMDVGMFVASNQSDYVYLGLKNETGNTVSNRQDAVLAWGDDPSGTNGPDNLRFIFTSPTTATQSPANTPNGLEISRMVPNLATTLTAPNYGMMGIGDFSPTGPNTAIANQVNAKLDIDGDLRIRTVTPDNNLTQVLVIDPLDKNRVHYRNIPNVIGSGQGFFDCTNTTIAPNLTSDSKINLNDHNLYFENNNTLNKNHVGIGYSCINTFIPGKLSVLQIHPSAVNTNTIAISGINSDISTAPPSTNILHVGVEGISNGVQNPVKVINIGGNFSAINSRDTRGIVVEIPASQNNTLSAIGGEFKVSASTQNNYGVNALCYGLPNNISNFNNTAVKGVAINSNFSNTGGYFEANSSFNTISNSIGINTLATGSSRNNLAGVFEVNAATGTTNIAVVGRTITSLTPTIPSVVKIGIYGNSIPILDSYAGFFDGNVWINGPATSTGFAVTTSDQNFKTDVHLITNADSILSQLQPKTFYFDTLNPYGFNFSNQLQYGLLAQEVELILPELVTNQFKPATVDSTGTVITQGVDYKALNYDAFISILISGHKEQKEKIDSLQNGIDNRDSLINNLNDRLTQLESCLSVILPLLCQISNSAIQPTQEAFQEQLKNEINVQLSNKNTIILNQNVPNPFAEQTQISFSIPETVKKAQIHFYDANGKLINSVEVQERGLGQLNVFANDLSTGVYTYSLVTDGQIIATKKMMKQ